MKKILSALIFGILLIGLVSAWGATRTVSGNTVTINVIQDTSSDAFTIQETVSSGVTITTFSPSSPTCILAGKVLTCDSEDSTKRVITYQFSGTGTTSGLVSQSYPPFGEKAMTGDNSLGVIIPGCVQNWSCGSWSSCVGGLQTRTCTDLNSCGNSTGKPSESQSCSLPGSTDTDDLMVNYVRGKILVNGNPAIAGTQYKVEVLTGTNEGDVYYGAVEDSKITSVGYSGLLNKGYFDTGDQIMFNTNDQFKVSLLNYNCTTSASTTGTFENGGNGMFEPESDLILLSCTKTNNAPVLTHINDITVNESQLVQIIASATDSDGDALTYSVNNSKFTNNGNGNFTWLTNSSDSGVYNVLVTVTDGSLNASQTVRVTIVHPNIPPTIHIDDQHDILEDSETHYTNITASDPDGTVVAFNILEENTSQVDCDTIYTDSVLKFTLAKDFYGIAHCKVEAIDNSGGRNSVNVQITVINVNDPPVIDSYTPNYDPKIPENGNQLFSVVVGDIDSPNSSLITNWSVDGVSQGLGNTFTFHGNGIVKDYVITVNVSDGIDSALHTWKLTTSDRPITEKYNGDTTNFSNLTDLNCVPLILERVGYGKIRWIDCVNMSDVVDLDRFTDIQHGLAGVDSFVFQSFVSKRAEISFPNLSFTKLPTIYYNSAFTTDSNNFNSICSGSICSDVSYVDSQLIFDVSSFSTFRAGDTRTCSEQGGIICKAAETCTGNWFSSRDSDRCCASQCEISFSKIPVCDVKNSSISVEFNDPDDGDEFEVGDTIEGEINIENNLDQKQKFDVNVYLYNVEKQKKIDTFKKKVTVDDKEDEDVEFTLEISEDLDEGTYYLFAKAEDDVCNQAYISIDVEEKEHYIVLDDVNINTPTIYPGSNLEGYAYVKNLGSNDEDVYLKAESPELGVSQKTETFEIQEGDKENKYFSLSIPSNVKEGTYNLILSAISSDSEDSEELVFSVSRLISIYQDGSSGSNPSVIVLGPGSSSGGSAGSSSGSQGTVYLSPSSSGASSSGGNAYVLKPGSSSGGNIITMTGSDTSTIRVNFQKESDREKESIVYVGVSPEKEKVIYVQEKSSSHRERNYLERTLLLLTGKTYEISQRMLLLIDLLLAGGIILIILSIVLWVKRL